MTSNGGVGATQTNRSQQTSLTNNGSNNNNNELGRELKAQIAVATATTPADNDSYGRYGRPEVTIVNMDSHHDDPIDGGGDASRRQSTQQPHPRTPENSIRKNSTTAADGPSAATEAHKSSDGPMSSIRSISQVIHNKIVCYREEGDFTVGCMKLFHTRTRFLILVLLLLCLASVWSNILCFNFAVICLNQVQGSVQSHNQTVLPSSDPTENLLGGGPIGNTTTASTPASEEESNFYTPNQRLWLTSSVAAAALAANFVVVSLVNSYGIRSIFALLGLLSSAATCFMPSAINMGYYYVLAARVLQGVAFSANFPVIGSFAAAWIYYKQSGLCVAVLVAYVQLAPAISMSASGALCSSAWGWPSVFYAHGCASAVLFVLFGVFYRNSPSKHPMVGDVEMKKIAVGKSELGKEMLKKIPYAEILKTASVWAVWIAALGNFFCVNMMFLSSPNYLHSVLGFSVRHTGFSASLAPLAQFGIKLFAGFTSDKVHFFSETNKLRAYNSIAFMGAALSLTLLAFFPTEYSTLCLMLLGVAAGLLGFTTGGFFKAGPLVSKHYSHFVTGNVSLGITLTMLFVPVMMAFLAPENTAAQWRNVFLCTAGVLCITNLLFVLMASAEPAGWTTDEFSRNASRGKVYSTTPSVPMKSMVAIG